MKILKVSELVEKLLRKYPHLRDNDEKLIATVWQHQAKKETGMTMVNLTAKGLMNLCIEKKVSQAESITRARRKLQEEHISLRGASYKPRKIDQQMETKKEIKEFSNRDQGQLF